MPEKSVRFISVRNSLGLLAVGALAITGVGACSSKPTVAVVQDGASGGSSGHWDGGEGNQFQVSDASGTGGASTQSDSGHNCGQSKMQATPRAVNVAIVLDRSLSMNTALSATETKSRWVAMREALNAAMQPVQDRVSFGLKIFPDGASATTCAVTNPGLQVDIGLGASVVAKIDETIGNSTPAGGTPIYDALKQVEDYFTGDAGSGFSGDRVVLLATDGAPNCNSNITCEPSTCTVNIEHPNLPAGVNGCDSPSQSQCLDGDRSIAQVKAMLAEGIRTVVVGIPGSDYSQYQAILDHMASEGGLPNPDPSLDYFPVSAASGVAGLQATLQSITTSLIVSCKLQLSSSPPDVGLLNVVIDGDTIPQSGPDGWTLDSTTSPPTVVLKGATCQFMETQGAQSVDITYGCPTVIVN